MQSTTHTFIGVIKSFNRRNKNFTVILTGRYSVFSTPPPNREQCLNPGTKCKLTAEQTYRQFCIISAAEDLLFKHSIICKETDKKILWNDHMFVRGSNPCCVLWCDALSVVILIVVYLYRLCETWRTRNISATSPNYKEYTKRKYKNNVFYIKHFFTRKLSSRRIGQYEI